MNAYETFLQLHRRAVPLLLGNIWDAHSARVFERLGFEAIGTSSAAVASAFGYEDGEKLPFELLLQLATKVAKEARIPFTVDIEGGYSSSTAGIITRISQLHDAGVAGVNLEDTIVRGTRTLQPLETFRETVATVASHISRNNMGIFLNIRTDAFLLGLEAPLPETLRRITAYEEAGAAGVFVPCIVNIADIAAVTQATHLPVNVMCMPGLPAFPELAAAGVKRISMGPFVHQALSGDLEKRLQTIRQEQSFNSLF